MAKVRGRPPTKQQNTPTVPVPTRQSTRQSTSVYANPTNNSDQTQQETGQMQQETEQLAPNITELITERVNILIAEALSTMTQSNDQSNSGNRLGDENTTTSKSSKKQTNRKHQDTGNTSHNNHQSNSGDSEGEQEESDDSFVAASKQRKRNSTKDKSKTKKAKRTKETVSDDEDGKSSGSETENSIESETEDVIERQSFGLMVGDGVPINIRKKIKSDKFIELIHLLPQNYNKEDHLILKASASKGVQIVKTTGPKFITLDQWNQAFMIYMAIYMETATTAKEAKLLNKQLLTYFSHINTLSKQNRPWYSYDRQFRLTRSSHSPLIPFSTIRYDLMLDATIIKPRDGMISLD